ncbi:MAG TPA: hypothetical protein VFK85_14535 [Anaeromyxobacteraceae bacterium]|nr:hypothetical protein [Anaeromyxobacteraceae bacterium]
MRWSLSILFAALLACETRATPEPCPGVVQGTFQLSGELTEGASCAETSGGATGAIDLTVLVSFTGESGAAVCLQRPLAEPLLGTREGDRIDVSAPARSGAARGCACTVQLLERISGTLLRDGGVVTGFSGELNTQLAPADGTSSCAAAAEAGACDVPCNVRWTLSSG